MRKIIEQQQLDLEIVDWYIKVLENGYDTKNILKDFLQAKEDIKVMQEKY